LRKIESAFPQWKQEAKMGEAKRRGTFEERRDQAEKQRIREREKADAEFDRLYLRRKAVSNLTLGGRQTGIGPARTAM